MERSLRRMESLKAQLMAIFRQIFGYQLGDLGLYNWVMQIQQEIAEGASRIDELDVQIREAGQNQQPEDAKRFREQ